MTPERKAELLQKAAQCWCDPRTSHLVMETNLAEVFHEALIEVERETWLKAAQAHTEWLKHAQMSGQSFEDVCRQHAEAAR